MFSLKNLAASAAFAVVTAFAPSMGGALTLTFQDSNSLDPVTLVLGGYNVVTDTDDATYTGFVGSFYLNGVSGSAYDGSSSSILSAVSGWIGGGDLDSTLTMTVEHGPYLGGSTGGISDLYFSVSGETQTSGTTVTAAGYAEDANGVYQVGSTFSKTNNGSTESPWSTVQTLSTMLDQPFILRQVFTFTGAGWNGEQAIGWTQFDATLISAVPLPAGGLLLLSALGGLGLVRRRREKVALA